MTPRLLLVALLLSPLPAMAAPDVPGVEQAMAALRAGDAPQAATIFLALARAGDADAQFNIALLFLDGVGVPQNDREALYWGWRARLSGVPNAPALLAQLMPAVPPELRQQTADRIATDLQPRIDAGEGRAMLERSVLLTDLLSEPDLQGAYVWQALSAAMGTPNAGSARDATLARIDPKDRLAAQDAAIAMLASLCTGGMQGHTICASLP